MVRVRQQRATLNLEPGAHMRPASISLADRARGAMLGAFAGGGESPLLEILAEELAGGHTDLRRLAGRWVERRRARPFETDPETAAALDTLDAEGAPPAGGGGGVGALARTVPVALVAWRSPRTLVSATYHIAALTHPAPEAAWAAVAVNVALGRLLEGRRDFIADVIEALAGNAAPEALLNAMRRVPRLRRDALPDPAAGLDAIHGAELVLGLAYHEPLATRGLDYTRRPGPSPIAAAAGALLGARDGKAALPARLIPEPFASDWGELAERLIQVAPVQPAAPHP